MYNNNVHILKSNSEQGDTLYALSNKNNTR